MSQQTSKKTGVKSSAEKASNTRHGTNPMPATSPVPGAFGKGGVENTDEMGSANRAVRRNTNEGRDPEGQETGEESA